MLPTISWPDAASGPVQRNLFTGQAAQVGQAYACRIEGLEAGAERLGTNLDGLLRRHVAAAFQAKRPKTPVGVWLAPFNDLFLVVVTTKAHTFSLDGLYDVPGQFETAQDTVPPTARPFALWDGRNLVRVYDKPATFSPGDRLLVDVGSLFGMTVGVADTQTVAMHAAGTSFDYSVVPETPEEIVELGGSRYVILHALLDPAVT